jgi:hypothetical protein
VIRGRPFNINAIKQAGNCKANGNSVSTASRSSATTFTPSSVPKACQESTKSDSTDNCVPQGASATVVEIAFSLGVGLPFLIALVSTLIVLHRAQVQITVANPNPEANYTPFNHSRSTPITFLPTSPRKSPRDDLSRCGLVCVCTIQKQSKRHDKLFEIVIFRDLSRTRVVLLLELSGFSLTEKLTNRPMKQNLGTSCSWMQVCMCTLYLVTGKLLASCGRCKGYACALEGLSAPTKLWAYIC